MNDTILVSTITTDATHSDLFESHMIILVTGTLLLSFLFLLSNNFESKLDGPSFLTTLCIFGGFLFLTPFLLIIFVLLKCYRLLCHFYLRSSCGNSYVGLLEGPDAFWTADESISRSVINILALVDFDRKGTNDCIKIMQSTIRRRLLENLENKYRKILFQRKSLRFGFDYWTRQENINIEDHVKLFKTNLPKESCTEEELNSIVSGICNLNLPKENSTNWEVVLVDSKVETRDGILSPLLIRIHHSVGDGFALVDMFLNVLTDSGENVKTNFCMEKTSKSINDDLDIHKFVATKHNNYKSASIISDEKKLTEYTPYTMENSSKLILKPKEKDNIESKCYDCNIHNHQSSNNEPSDKSCKTKFFIPNVAKLNWSLLKMKTKILMTGKTKGKVNDTSIYFETLAELHKLKRRQEFKETFPEKTILKNQDKSSNERETVCKGNLKEMKHTNIYRNVMKLDLKQENTQSVSGTLYMNEMYFTPLSPLKVTIQDCCKSMIKCSKLVLTCELFLKCPLRLLKQTSNKLFSFPLLRCKKIIDRFSEEFTKIIHLPVKLVHRRIDENRLHNGSKGLTLAKTISCITDDNLLEMIKQIKKTHNIKFNEVLLRSVSDSLEMYFNDKTEFVNVIIPIPISTQRKKMENDFTVCIFDLPVNRPKKTEMIHKKYLDLEEDYEIALNYYILKYIIDSIPHCLLKHVVKSQHNTLVLSNMIGPNQQILFSGHTIKRLTFFIPNRDTTGVGITFLSYNNQLSIGIIMDDSLGNSNDDVNKIVENIKNSIYHMYAECF